MQKLILSVFFLLLIIVFNTVTGQTQQPFRYNTNMMTINEAAVQFIYDTRLSIKKGVTLKPGVEAALNGERTDPDIVINVQAPSQGDYVMTTYAVTNAEGDAYFQQVINKNKSLFIRIQYGEGLFLNRVVAVPWNASKQTIGRFSLSGNIQKLKIWLPRGINFDYVEFVSYAPPVVPSAALNYSPILYPPSSHPRIWVTQNSLKKVKDNLNVGENAAMWVALQNRAKQTYSITFDPTVETIRNQDLELACVEKAFYYMVTGDTNIGNEAISLMTEYLNLLSFGNLLDITRSIGESIHHTSMIYDWCYPLLSSQQKKLWIEKMIRLAEDMQIGWPPFKIAVTHGHGSEAMLNRDLLSMSLAISDEKPEAYKYCFYRLYKEIIPMRRFEYQSSRHPQGVNYGAYKTSCELCAANYFKIMFNRELFDANIKNLFNYFTYMKVPDGQMLRDADGLLAPQIGQQSYQWKNPRLMFLSYVYSEDLFQKGEFLNHGGPSSIPAYLFLLLNNPYHEAIRKNDKPLTVDFGDITGGMIARTGWDSLDDVVVEIKGGGYKNGGHMHSDAGAIQLYYRGFQLGDVGMYLFGGTPYHMNFARRSVAHSMMLVNDPNESFVPYLNDWGQRLAPSFPYSPENVMNNEKFKNGQVVSCSFGPSKTVPAFSYFSVDLASAYSNKITQYVRSFCFLNLFDKNIPGVIILTDDISTSNPSFKKFWQINSTNIPIVFSNQNILLSSQVYNGPVGRTHITMLLPKPNERTHQILKGKDALTVAGTYLEVPPQNYLEKDPKRLMITPIQQKTKDRFLTVFQITNGSTQPLSIDYTETSVSYNITIANRIVCMSNSAKLIENNFQLTVPNSKQYQLALTGLKGGIWEIENNDNGMVLYRGDVKKRDNSIFIESIPAGSYTVKYAGISGIKNVSQELDFIVEGGNILFNNVDEPIYIFTVDGKLVQIVNVGTNQTANCSVNTSGLYVLKSGRKVSKVIIHANY